MKLKHLEIKLQQHVKYFQQPKIELEQFHTPPDICATVVHCMYSNGDVEGLQVCDLGCGTGMLSIACVLMGAAHVLSVDVDKDALEVLESNKRAVFEDEEDLHSKLEVICENVVDLKLDRQFDVVVMNPPFGTRVKGADMAFLKSAASLGNVVYSMHKTSTRKHVDKAGKSLNLEGKPIAQLRYNLDNTYEHHKKKSVDIEVDLWRFQRK